MLLVACKRAPAPRDPVVVVPDAAASVASDAAPDAVVVAPADAAVATRPDAQVAVVQDAPPADVSRLPCKVDREAQRKCRDAKQIYGQSLSLKQCGGAMIPPDIAARRAKQPCACYNAAEANARADECRLRPSAPPRPK